MGLGQGFRLRLGLGLGVRDRLIVSHKYYITHSKDSETPTLLDEAEQERRLAERQRIFKEYRASRQAVLELRNEDRLRRNEAKVKQLEMVDQWQVRPVQTQD